MPWTLNNDYNPDVIDEAGKVICTIHGYGTPGGRRNARLICAAPELYRLLKEILEHGALAFDGTETRAKYILARIDKEDAE